METLSEQGSLQTQASSKFVTDWKALYEQAKEERDIHINAADRYQAALERIAANDWRDAGKFPLIAREALS